MLASHGLNILSLGYHRVSLVHRLSDSVIFDARPKPFNRNGQAIKTNPTAPRSSLMMLSITVPILVCYRTQFRDVTCRRLL
jgi:hypothetical protein